MAQLSQIHLESQLSPSSPVLSPIVLTQEELHGSNFSLRVTFMLSFPELLPPAYPDRLFLLYPPTIQGMSSYQNRHGELLFPTPGH